MSLVSRARPKVLGRDYFHGVTLSRPCGRGYPVSVSGDVRAGSRLRDLRDRSSESCAHTVSPIMTGPNEYLSFDERDPVAARREMTSVTERRPTTRLVESRENIP